MRSSSGTCTSSMTVVNATPASRASGHLRRGINSAANSPTGTNIATLNAISERYPVVQVDVVVHDSEFRMPPTSSCPRVRHGAGPIVTHSTIAAYATAMKRRGRRFIMRFSSTSRRGGWHLAACPLFIG